MTLEERALKEHQLDIGRCVEIWNVRALLRSIGRSLQDVVSVQKYLGMVCKSTHICCKKLFFSYSVTDFHLLFFYNYKVGEEQGNNNDEDYDGDKQATSSKNPVINS